MTTAPRKRNTPARVNANPAAPVREGAGAAGKAKRKPPVGAEWRILAHGRGSVRLDLRSADYPTLVSAAGRPPLHDYSGQRVPTLDGKAKRTVFDELVISGVLHVEQLDARTWWVGITNGEMFTVTVGRNGKVTRGAIYT